MQEVNGPVPGLNYAPFHGKSLLRFIKGIKISNENITLPNYEVAVHEFC